MGRERLAQWNRVRLVYGRTPTHAARSRSDRASVAQADDRANRSSWALAKTLVPDGFDDYLTHVERALEDTRFVSSSKRAAEAASWDPDDPRIAELATAMADHYLANPAQLKIVTGLQARTEGATRYKLIATHGEERALAAARPAGLVETRLRSAGIRIPRPDSH